MKLRYFLSTLFFSVIYFLAGAQEPFISTWKTDNPGFTQDDQVRILTGGMGLQIYWEDVDDPTNNGSRTGGGAIDITFPRPGVYRIEISGNLRSINIANGYDNLKLISLDQWGDIEWESFRFAFWGCSNMEYNAADVPDLSRVLNMWNAFRGCILFDGDLSDWDVSNVTDMRGLFWNARAFSHPLDSWDVSSVTSMEHMFTGAESFNHPLDSWDVSNVTNMGSMFGGASSFDQPLENWDVSSVTNMSAMFANANSYDQPLENWDVSNVTNMVGMFAGASSYDQPLENWDVSNVTNISRMFSGASSFDQPLENWDVSNVTNMGQLFYGAVLFNQPIENWDVSMVTNMERLFGLTANFDQPIANWDVSNVENMYGMFAGTELFNQPIGNWDVRNVNDMSWMFNGAQSFNQPLENWDVSSVENMETMFNYTEVFNQNLELWDVSSVKSMSFMFANTKNFNQPLETWDVSGVESFTSMFERSEVFNQSLNQWNVGSGIYMWRMFNEAKSFDQNLGNWELSPELTLMVDMFNNSGVSCENYDLTLIGWNHNPIGPENASFGAEGMHFWQSDGARDSLINLKGWTIVGDKYAPNCIPEDCELAPTTLTFLGQHPSCPGEEVLLRAETDGVEYIWFKNGQPMDGQTEQTLLVTEAAFYSVIYTDDQDCESEESDALEVIFLDDTSPPVLLNGEDAVLRSTQPNCRGFAFWSAEIEVCGDLSEVQKRSLWRLDLHNTGQFDIISTQPRPDGSARNNLRIEEELPFGTHRVKWEIRDQHENVVIEEQLLTLVDMNPPTPVCLHGIAASIHPSSGQITLPAWVYDVGSWDDCTDSEDLIFTYSSDLSHTHHSWNCDDLDGEREKTIEIEIWVTNKYGHQNHCATYIKVQDNRDVCPATSSSPRMANKKPLFTTPAILQLQTLSEDLEEVIASSSFTLYPNRPNPFTNATTIDFELPESGSVNLSIYNPYGARLYHRSRTFPEGSNEWRIEAADLPHTGLYIYRLSFNGEFHSRRMLKMEN